MRDALSRGFRQIASYIFGRNADNESASSPETHPRFLDGSAMGGGSGKKISMTSPVVTRVPPLAGSSGPSSSSPSVSATETVKGYVVAFVMPASKYKSAAELPRPANPNVKLRDVPSKVSAVLGWRGGPRVDEKMVAERRRELDEALRRAGIKPLAGAGVSLFFLFFSLFFSSLFLEAPALGLGLFYFIFSFLSHPRLLLYFSFRKKKTEKKTQAVHAQPILPAFFSSVAEAVSFF